MSFPTVHNFLCFSAARSFRGSSWRSFRMCFPALYNPYRRDNVWGSWIIALFFGLESPVKANFASFRIQESLVSMQRIFEPKTLTSWIQVEHWGPIHAAWYEIDTNWLTVWIHHLNKRGTHLKFLFLQQFWINTPISESPRLKLQNPSCCRVYHTPGVVILPVNLMAFIRVINRNNP